MCFRAMFLMLSAAAAFQAGAQAYPTRPITLIVPYAPGGSVDPVARMVTPKLSERLGQPIVIDNAVGAGGVIGTTRAANAAPDGYTLLFSVESTMIIAKLVTPSTVKYDGLRDFAPISLVGTSPLVLVGKPTLPASNAAELVKLMRAQPGAFNFASSGIGTSLHLAGELINQAARVQMVHVPYKVGAQIVTDLAGNQIELAILPLVSAHQPARAGRIKAFGVIHPKRWPTAPEIPSLASAAEFKNLDALVWFGLFAPAKTDGGIVGRLAKEMSVVLADTDVVKRLEGLDLVPSKLTPAEFGTFLRKEQEKFAAVVKTANVRAE